MSAGLVRPGMVELRHELAALRGNWLWFVILGVALAALGMVAIGATFIASLAATVALGALILVGGVTETIGAFWCRAWSGFFAHLLTGVLSIVIGMMFLKWPLNALVALTLLVAAYLMVEGVFKVVAAFHCKFARWGWPMLSGFIDVLLGIMIWQGWPASALWVVGLFVGISMVFRGLEWVALGLGLRSLPTRVAA